MILMRWSDGCRLKRTISPSRIWRSTVQPGSIKFYFEGSSPKIYAWITDEFGTVIDEPLGPWDGAVLTETEVHADRTWYVHDFGDVSEVNFIVATQNNYHAIDHAIGGAARHFMPQQNDDLLMNGVEFVLRCFDPCLACATHTAGRMGMEIELRRHGEVIRHIRRSHQGGRR